MVAVSRALVGIGLALCGALIGVAGADKRAVLAGASLSGLGLSIATVMLEPTVVLLRDFAVRNSAVIVWQAFPRDLTFLLITCLFMVFPGSVADTVVLRLARVCVAIGVAARTGTLVVAQIPGVLERRLTIGQQVGLLHIEAVLRLSIIVTSVACCIYLVASQARLYRRLALQRADRSRATVVGWAVFVAVVPALIIVLIQAVALFAGRQAMSPPVMAGGLIPFLSIPIALVYSLLSTRVDPVGVLVRRAVLFSVSVKTARFVSLVPLAAFVIFLYAHRETPLTELLASRPVLAGTSGVAALGGLLYRDRARAALERLFFRDRADVRRLMTELAEKCRAVSSPQVLETLLSGEISAALHAEAVALFVRDKATGTFVGPGRRHSPLFGDARLIGLAGERGVLDLDPDDRRSPLASLPEIERQWVAETHARLLLALRAADGAVIGLLAVGEKLSELPFDVEDEQLLSAVVAAGALALENSLLRASGGATAATLLVAANEEEELARSCPSCSQLFSPAFGGMCPRDRVPLAVAEVPHVLLGKYRFERRIGTGGMGVVYLARDLSLGRLVAVKTLPKVSAHAAMRLRREARATARVLHPNLAVIFAAETWRETPMLVLEYLEGGTLEERIRGGPIPIEKIVKWGIALTGALEAAHANGVLHRDIKPSNVGFTASGEPKLLDFGLASLLEGPELLAAVEASASTQSGHSIQSMDLLETAEVRRVTVSGRIVGTVPYIAPEAILGETPQVSFDLWGLAVTLYEATTGSNPFLEMPAEKTFNRILSLTPPAARTVRTDCPEELSELLVRALARRPSQRPRSARELRRAFQRLVSARAA